MAKVVALVKERVDFVKEIWEQAWFFFERPVDYDEKMVSKRWKEDTPEMLQQFVLAVREVDPFTAAAIHDRVGQFLQDQDLGMGQVMPLVRLALVGSGMGPGVTEMMEVMGKEETVSRIDQAIQTIK